MNADLVIVGAPVYAGMPWTPPAEALAVRGGRIAGVGTAEQIHELIGPATRQVHLDGGMVVPGFQDSHVHPDHGGLVMERCSLHDVRGPEGYQRAIRAYVQSHPDVSWVLGGGWTLDDFPRGCPHRSILDAVVGDRPVYLPNRDGHDAWVNSRALELAGITRSTSDPPDGRIEREEDGSPFGVLHEGAMDLVARLIPAPTPAELDAALLAAQAHLHSLGVTAWQDAHVTEQTLAAYLRLQDRGELTARVVGALWWARDRGAEQAEDLMELRARAGVGRFQATSVKIMQDGIPENFTAAMLDPYLDDGGGPTDRRGLSFIEPGQLNRAAARLDREGFQVHVHAIGDRAVREALDAFESALAANGPGDHRHHIAHLQVVHPDDVPRFAALDVTANCQPYWACLDGQMRDLCIPSLGPERSRWQYPFASLRRTGARLAFGSDWPVTTPDPLKEIQVAVTRIPFEDPDREAFVPDERLDLADALDAFTAGTAFVNHRDEQTGTLEVGKAADLVVLDRNLFKVQPMEIGAVQVLATLVEGRAVHLAPRIEGAFD